VRSALVLDVKVGSGAFMKRLDDARTLATTLAGIGRRMGKRVSALLTRMDEPLGRAGREGDEQPVLEQRFGIDLTASKGQGEQQTHGNLQKWGLVSYVITSFRTLASLIETVDDARH